MAIVLRQAGHQVRAAASRAEALGALDHFAPDLLLSDWLLEGETGYEATLAVRERVPGVRALFITGFPAETVHEQARQVSPWPILEKPLEIDALVRAVEDALDSLGVGRGGRRGEDK
ncbi:MAG: response regulator [Planctomycetota bacterium]